MALKIFDTLAPQGDYPAVEAKDVLMADGKRLSEWTGGGSLVGLTHAQHNALNDAGVLDEGATYLIVKVDSYMPKGLSQEQIAVLAAAGLLPGGDGA